MKTLFSKKIVLAIGAMLLLAGVVYSQTSIYEIEGILQLRAQNPQIRIPGGTATVRDYTGTNNVALAHARPAIVSTATARTLTVGECGAVIIANGAVAAQTFTLPAVANAGCSFTFITGFVDATTQIIFVSAEAGTDCIFTHFAAVGANADTAIVTETDCVTGIKNTAATNAIGDSITIMSDGTRWVGVGIASGIWAVVS